MLLNDFFSLFFPNTCLICGKALARGEEYICLGCYQGLPKNGNSLGEDQALRKRFFGRLAVQNAYAYLKFLKQGAVQQLMHAIKYDHQPELAERLGWSFGRDLLKMGLDQKIDIILPIPLHPSKQRRRGYNQSDYLAKGLSEGLEVTWSDKVLARKTNSSTQTRKNRMQRWENVKNIFEVIAPRLVKEKRVLLVDDIITTGATLESCGHALLKAGCAEISIAALAVAH